MGRVGCGGVLFAWVLAAHEVFWLVEASRAGWREIGRPSGIIDIQGMENLFA